MGECVGVDLPVATVEVNDTGRLDGRGVETPDVDAEAVGIRSGYVERLDTAVLAEVVLSRLGIERVGGERFVALNQPEP